MSCTDVQTIQAGNGSKTQFSFDFPYIFKSEIHVYFWNATTKEWDEKLTTDATYPWQVTDANPTIVEFTSTAPPEPADPVDPNESTIDNVKIRRITNLDDIRALFNPGSAIRSDDLNNNFEQLRYAIQESNCPGVTDEVYEYLLENYWDRFDNTLYSADTWRSDDATIATTAALDQRFQDEVNDTLTKAELAALSDVMPDNDDAVPTTGATKDYIDHVIETDILVNTADGLAKSASDGVVTISITDGGVDLAKIKAEDLVTSAEANPNNDNTIATTAKIDDMIDAAITGDIAGEDGIDVVDDGDGTITIGISANSVDFDRIKNSDIITESEQDAGSPAPADTNIFTALAAARRFDTFVQTGTPSGSDWEVGKTWLQNDSDLTLSVWNGSAWTAITSGGTFTNQPNVVYVDASSGDDNNDGHRISRPKLSITSAIDQINGEISLSTDTDDGFNGGSSYVDGTYTGVSLTHSSGTGIGTGLTATVGVSGGAVTSVTLSAAQQTVLEEYSIGDVLTASNTELGNSGSGLLIPITGDGDGQIVVVAAGVYREAAPIQIKRRNVSIIGQALRSCIVHPTVATENNNLFELNSGSYISNLTLTGVQAGTGTGNTLDATLPTTQGWNFAFYDGAYIVKSPYIQNCTNFSDSEIDNSDLLAHRPRGGAAGDTDSAPTGGGMLVNGATPDDDSPLRSMVADSYTHVGLNGPGVLVTNNGYAQITSSYAFFNKYHIKCLNGGQANLAASTTDFGDQALVADGRSTSAIFTADLSTAAGDGDITFTIDAPTAAAGWHGTATRPQGNMLVELNSITYPILSATANGAGWDVTISRPNPNNRSENLGLNGAVATPATASFFLRSMVASSGHTMEYVGSGTNYSALPENGGVPDETKQITESNNGKVWTAITDHNGKFKIGGNQTDDPIFEVDQQLGFVTIPEGSIAFNLLSDLTPQLGGNLDVNGQTITSASNGNIVIDPDGTGVIELGSNVGVGTASPQGILETSSSSASNVYLTSTGGNSNLRIVADDGQRSQIIFGDTADALTGGITFDHSDNSLQFLGHNYAERARIDSSGRLLVGTSSDFGGAQIQAISSTGGMIAVGRDDTSVDTAGQLIGRLRFFGNATTEATREEVAAIICASDGPHADGDKPGRLVFSTTADGESSPTERMRIDSSGNVGIGVTSPSAPLQVQGNAGEIRIQRPTASQSDWSMQLPSSSGEFQIYDNNNTTARLTIDSSGNLGIGQLSPAQLLDVNGDALINGLTIGMGAGSLEGNTAIGQDVLGSATTGGEDNTGVGQFALQDLTTGQYNTGIGRGAGANITTADANTFLGRHAGFNTTTGSNNTGLGENALNANVAGQNATAIGRRSQLYANDSETSFTNSNVSVGYESLRGGSTTPADNTGSANTAIGYQAGLSTTSGSHCTILGYRTAFDNQTGDYVTAIGSLAAYESVALSSLTAIGYQSQRYANDTTTATNTYNTSVGHDALRFSTTPADNTGTHNTAMGHVSLQEISSGSFNVGYGNYTLSDVSTGNRNTACGYAAGTDITTAEDNTAIGQLAFNNATVVSNCTAVGYESQRYADSTTTAKDGNNTSVGWRALRGSTTAANNTGIRNTAVGNGALQVNTSANNNCAFGVSALVENTTGSNNTAIGYQALRSNTTGANNSAIGQDAGRYDQDGNDTANFTNCTYLGHDTRASGNNQVILGDSASDAYLSSGTTQVTSDERDKADIRDTLLGLDFINALRPVDYRWDPRVDYFDTEVYEEEVTEIVEVPNPAYVEDGDEPEYIEETVTKMVTKDRLVPVPKDGSRKRNRFHHGLIAQEVKAVADAMGVDFAGYQDHKINGGNDKLTMGYTELIAPLIKAVQELSAENAALKARLDALEAN